MDLNILRKYKKAVVQCHDVPDADAVASGFALCRALRGFGAEAALVYGGHAAITKPSLLIMIDMLEIDIRHVSELPQDIDLLITTDCQRGAGNVQKFDIPDGADVYVIDHHRPEIEETPNVAIRPHLASCATLVWDLMNNAGIAVEPHVRYALYYGLFSDTNGMSELRHPLDRDLAEAQHDAGMVRKLKNSAITAEELDIISSALLSRETYTGAGGLSVALFSAKPCDANILGFTSDIAQQVAHMDCAVAFCPQPQGLKLSIRSAVREVMANEIAEFLCRGVGSGGGGIEKAGGFLSFKGIEGVSALGPSEYLAERVKLYVDNYDWIYAAKHDEDFGAYPLYRKLALPVGFAKSSELWPPGAKITVRTLEGDVDTVSAEDLYLMIGIRGECYPIMRERFEASYTAEGTPYTVESEYTPIIINRVSGERKAVMPHAQTCVPSEAKFIRARRLDKDTKVFTEWDKEKYFSGKPGDWLAAVEGDYHDCYVVRSDIFEETYEQAQG